MHLLDRLGYRMASAFPGNLAVKLNRSPLCTFTFDDCHRTAFDVGARILSSNGCAGTYFVTGGSLDDPEMLQREHIEALEANGHEVGCHTYSHSSVRSLSVAELKADLDRNAECLNAAGIAGELATFSYPFGETSLASKSYLGSRFGACRGVREGLNGKLMDLSELKACRIFHEGFSKPRLEERINTCKRRGAWLIFYTHDVRDDPSEWGCTPAELEWVLEAVSNAGVEVLPMKSALGKVMFRAPS